MNRLITWLLINSLSLQLTGCYTFSELESTEVQNEKVIDGNTILITLKTGREYYSEVPFHRHYTDTSEYFLGQGRIYKSRTSEGESFNGQIYAAEIDSSKQDNNFIHLWLKTKDKIVFEKNNYQKFPADNQSGLLLTDSGKTVKIQKEDIESIEIKQFNWPLTIVYGTIIIAAITSLIIVFKGLAEFKLFEN